MGEHQEKPTVARPATVADARTVVDRWRSETLELIDLTVRTATPIDMEWLNGRVAALNNVLQLLDGRGEPASLRSTRSGIG